MQETTGEVHAEAPRGRYLLTLSMGALGVVFGDIGTSPLYALRECFSGQHGLAPTPANVLGVLSLVFWSLVLVISVKYLAVVLRADNKGEGGILVLMSLLRPHERAKKRSRFLLVVLGVFGAALLYGDGVVTPAISVLSAVEGLDLATPAFAPYTIPATVLILLVLFSFQRRGTAGIGAVFGPVMLTWFSVIGLLGLFRMGARPEILGAVSPLHAIRFFVANGTHGFLVLGAVVLCVTGGEALYADMGHFGKRPIRVTWFALVLPSLLLNYFGQGALLLASPAAAKNPFFLLAPSWALFPMVALATVATVIASQAVISGAFSLTRQAIQLGYLPRLKILHTSSREIGQIYLPAINWSLAAACIWLVLEFRTSSNLAAAYGIAVTSTMGLTTLLLTLLAREKWGTPLWVALPLGGLFLVVDLAFFGANAVKIASGGWFPLALAAVVFVLMTTWKRGREILEERLREKTTPLPELLAAFAARNLPRVPGTAVFMDRLAEGTPPALVHNVRHNMVIHDRVVLLTVLTEEVPRVAESEKIETQGLGNGFHRVLLRYGFMEDPDIPEALSGLLLDGRALEVEKVTFFLGRERLLATERIGMAIWRERLFAFMARAEGRATGFFRIPPGQVVEIGIQVEL